MIRNISNKYDNCKDEIWAGYSDEKNENNFIDVDGNKMKWSNWNFGEPNGGEVENCVTIKKAFTNDQSCFGKGKFCTMCQITKKPEFTLRGVCPSEKIDIKYSLILNNIRNGRHSLRGWRNSEITWNKTI